MILKALLLESHQRCNKISSGVLKGCRYTTRINTVGASAAHVVLLMHLMWAVAVPYEVGCEHVSFMRLVVLLFL